MKDAQLSKAETETKELIAKLEHLRNLLLAEDLDFQLKLARLRQMRETLGQLDRIVKEERRELGWSRFALEQRKRLARFTTRRPDLESLVRDQQAVIADTRNISEKEEVGEGSPDGDPRPRDEAPERGGGAGDRPVVRRPSASPPAASRLVHRRGDEVHWKRPTRAPPSRPRTRHLARCATSSRVWTNRSAETERTIAQAEFNRRAGDQAKNRGTAESLEATSARLGDVGVALRKDLIRASASMRTAEQQLAKTDGRSGGRRPVGRARCAGEVARRVQPVDRAAARGAPRRAPDPADQRPDRDARAADSDPRNEPGPGPQGLAEIPDGAA